MSRFFPLFSLVLLFVATTVQAQLPAGAEVANFPCYASKVLADVARARVYVTDLNNNSVAVIDPSTLAVVATVPVGPGPKDMAISRDGSTLYVVNNASNVNAVSVIDLSTLTLKNSFPLPGAPGAVAVGLDGRIYVGVTGVPVNAVSTNGIYQIDGTTGAIQTTFGRSHSGSAFLQITPDGKILFVADNDSEPNSIESFDVSTASPTARQLNVDAGENDKQLVVSHNGNYLCNPAGGGNDVGGDDYTTALFSTTDINVHYGVFNNILYPGPLAFSPDDSLIYQVSGPLGRNVLQIFNTATFIQTTQVAIPKSTLDVGYGDDTTDIVADSTGSYLFVAQRSYQTSSQPGLKYAGILRVLSTGTGPLQPPLPVVNVTATVPKVTVGSGRTGIITITLDKASFADLKVKYTLQGTAKNGVDYTLLKSKLKFKAGQTSKDIKINPLDGGGGASKRIVKLTLTKDDNYTSGTNASAKVKIVSPP